MMETFHFAAGHRDSKEGLKKGHTITSLQSARKVDCRSAETLSCHPLLLYLPLPALLRATYPNPCPLCTSRPSSAQDGSFMHSESSFPSLSVINKHVAMFFMSEKTDTTSDLEQKAGKFPRCFGTSVLWVGSTLLHTQHLPSFPIPSWCQARLQLCTAPAVVCTSGKYVSLSIRSSQQPTWRHHFPPAYSARNGGRKVKQPAQGTFRLLRAWQKSLRVRMAQTVLVSSQ